MDETAGWKFYRKQIRALESGNFDALMEQYSDDAQLVGFDFVVVGKEEIRRHMEEYLQRLGKLQLISTDKWSESGDTIFYEATLDTAEARARVYDAFVLRNGKATHHFTGVIMVMSRE
ncbi:MAG: nuclear transport factor 2 family protein [Chloroflexota bacterium]|nr:nuclear transport factor 2 family protein [Chloroflexota bacterium]